MLQVDEPMRAMPWMAMCSFLCASDDKVRSPFHMSPLWYLASTSPGKTGWGKDKKKGIDRIDEG